VTDPQTATAADPVQFRDAFGPLAEAAYYTQKLDIGRAAAERAVANRATDAEAVLLLGQIANAQFLVDKDDVAQKARADAEWEAARAAFAKAAELFAARTDPLSRAREAAARLELARHNGWKQKVDDASREYALAIALDPAHVDFREVLNILSAPGSFLACLEAAEKEFVKTHGSETNLDAAIVWWLGWARFQEKQYAPAEEAFASAVKKWPAFVNSWFYIGHARYQQQKFDEAVVAFRKNWELDPADLATSIAANRDFNLSILGFLAGKSFTAGKLSDATVVAEILVQAAPEKDDYWNNLGLFSRDAGDQLAESKKPEDREKAKALYERAYEAYTKALEISPEDANYLNDTAVVLHYNLHRDLDKAKALYEKAYANATADLARKDLSPDLRDKRETAQRDSKNNLEKLARGVKKDGE
jgi:tetratricopeptide (TPR) repeat protein